MDTGRVLSENDIERVHRAAEWLLETVGFRVTHARLLGKARAAGAVVDEQRGMVRAPAALLRELLGLVPRTYTIAWQDGTRVPIGDGRQHCLAIVTDPWIIDYATQRPRRPCLEDVRRHTIIAQKLERVAAVSRMDFPVTDVTDATSSLRALEMHLLHYGKHYCAYVASLEGFRQWLDIGAILAQGQDLARSGLMSVAVAVVSPLTLTDMNVELLEGACAHQFAVVPTVCPMAGSTSPYTRAATLVQGHAENLFVAAMAQLIHPGNPFLYTFGPSVTDMRSGHDLYYTLDKALWKIASVQLARSLGIPCGAECGGSMTYRYDQQNGAEGFLFMQAAHASKADLLCGIGSCHNAVGMSAEMMIIQDEWLKAAEHLEAGIPMDDYHLGLDSLRDAGPGGHFLTDRLTLDLLYQGEFFASEIFDLEGGYHDSPSMLERAHERVEAMVAEFESPLPGKVQEELRRYFHDQYRTMT